MKLPENIDISVKPAKNPPSTEPPPRSEDINDLKLEINRLIWQYAPYDTTLGQADDMACKILNSIFAGKYLI